VFVRQDINFITFGKFTLSQYRLEVSTCNFAQSRANPRRFVTPPR